MITENRLTQIHKRLSPLQEALLNHPIYGEIDRIQKLHLFMRYHVFAVWDFMSLLKTLQQRLCCLGVPWLPPADPKAARFVNEIVLGEETDEDGQGGFCSHFELYRKAMRHCGATTHEIDRFLDDLRQGHSIELALAKCEAPLPVREFVLHTLDVIEGGDLCGIASAFLFGREDLLPAVFQRIVDELNLSNDGSLEDFKYYLNRHIELDGDHHGPMAAQLISSLCGDDETKWRVAEEAAVGALQARKALWDGMYDVMRDIHETNAGRI